jgi:apolipoprotein N-acyltransferase
VSATRRSWRVAAAAFAGAFLALVGPPTNLYPALWLGMTALAYLVDDEVHRETSSRWPRVRRAFDGAGLGLAFGVGANLVFLRFVPATVMRFTSLPFAAAAVCLGLLSVLQGLRWAAVAVVQVQLARRGVPSWIAFAVGVFASTFVPVVFPWTPLGLISPVPEMIQLADLLGASRFSWPRRQACSPQRSGIGTGAARSCWPPGSRCPCSCSPTARCASPTWSATVRRRPP